MSQKLQKWVRMDKNGLVWIKMGQDGQKWDGRDGITEGVRWAAGGLVTAQRGAGCGGFGGTGGDRSRGGYGGTDWMLVSPLGCGEGAGARFWA